MVKRMWPAVLVVLLFVAQTTWAQFMVRGGLSGGTGTGDWGRMWGMLIGIDELVPSRAYGWWSTQLDVSRSFTRLSDAGILAGVKLVDPFTSPPDTTRFENGFNATSITLGGRYEPCRRSLGFRQTPRRIISPFVGWHLGYTRFEHDQVGSTRSVAGLTSAHGVPVGASVGLLMGWGGPPETALDPNVSSTYWGVEISVDVGTTVWLKNHQIVPSVVTDLPGGLDAPVTPTISLRVTFMYRTAPVRGS